MSDETNKTPATPEQQARIAELYDSRAVPEEKKRGITIDQIYRSPDLALITRRLGEPTGSDHRPVITEFTRAQPPR